MKMTSESVLEGAASAARTVVPAKAEASAAARVSPPPGDVAYAAQTITGASSNRVDIWFVADGYTADQADQIADDVAAQMRYLTTDSLADPFGRYASYFNVHVVTSVSAEEGADRPDDGVFVDTAFDASYSWGGGPARLLYFDTFKADTAIDQVRPTGIDIDMRLGVVNSAIYGGGGGSYAVYSAGVASAGDLALHEIGHSFANLADEYFTPGAAYTGGERPEPNVTIDPTGARWAEWIGFDDGILGPIGAYEGGYYAETGVYRPTVDSKMRSLGRPFDAIAKEAFVLAFYDEVDPLDAWAFRDEADLGLTLTDEYGFFVDAIDESLIQQEWSVDGVLVAGETGTELSIGRLGLSAGRYTLSVRAYDDTDLVRGDRSSLEQTVSWVLDLSYAATDGTGGADALDGTAGRDRLAGLGGDDRLFGLDGDDLLLGGGGGDTLVGGLGSDVIQGGAGADVIYGDLSA